MVYNHAPPKELRVKHKLDKGQRLRILLTNGRFPVSLDLARQLHKVGHTIYVVDPMHFHICKFSVSVKKSFYVPAPHEDGPGYVEGVRKAVREAKIQLIIPMHEEIFFLSQHEDLKPLLFAPDFPLLVSLHNKWEFFKLVTAAGLGAPPSILCTSMDDIHKLDLDTKEYALKPVFGRAKSGIHHHEPGKPLPDNLHVSEENQYIAQEWINGTQICSYGVARNGELKACAIYPVIDTIDGSSCVYFKSIEHPKIKEFMKLLAEHYNITGQLAFDFIDTPDKLYCIECNPRATSGIHLFKHTSWLSEAFTDPSSERHDPKEGWARQMIPGMMMWEHSGASMQTRIAHMKRLFRTRDVTFAKADPGPALFQPFLLAAYKQLCHEKKLALPELFQWDMIWEPSKMELEKAKEQRPAQIAPLL